MQSLTELSPVGFLEELFADEILRLTTRLGRTDLTEDQRNTTVVSLRRDMAELRTLQTDRRLKEEHNLDLPGLISAKEILRFRKLMAKLTRESGRPYPHAGSTQADIEVEEANAEADLAPADSVAASEAHLHQLILEEEQKQLKDFTEPTQFPLRRTAAVPRNAPCPCHSGQKYKRCCGHWSKSTPLGKAA